MTYNVRHEHVMQDTQQRFTEFSVRTQCVSNGNSEQELNSRKSPSQVLDGLLAKQMILKY